MQNNLFCCWHLLTWRMPEERDFPPSGNGIIWGACERSMGWSDTGSSCISACCRWRRTACRHAGNSCWSMANRSGRPKHQVSSPVTVVQTISAGCGFYVFIRDAAHLCLMRGWKTAGELGGYRKGTSYQLALNWEDAATNCVIGTLKEFTRDYLKRADGGFHVELRSGTWSVVVKELRAGWAGEMDSPNNEPVSWAWIWGVHFNNDDDDEKVFGSIFSCALWKIFSSESGSVPCFHRHAHCFVSLFYSGTVDLLMCVSACLLI